MDEQGQGGGGAPGAGLWRKLHEAQQAVAAVAKTGTNEHFRYNFVEEHAVLGAARDALGQAGLAYHVSVDRVEDRVVTTSRGREELLTDVYMTVTLADTESGESIRSHAVGRGQDGQDKGVNKAIVAGLKYWLMKTLMMPTGEDPDAQGDPAGNVSAGTNGNGRRMQQGAPDMIPCPACDGDMWDNRGDKRSPNSPDLKCKSKECGNAIWLPTWRDELLEAVASAHAAGAMDDEGRKKADDMVAGMSPRDMLRIQARLRELEPAGAAQ